MRKLQLIGEWQMGQLLKQYDSVVNTMSQDIAIGYAFAREYVDPTLANILQFKFVLKNRHYLEIEIPEANDGSCDVQS